MSGGLNLRSESEARAILREIDRVMGADDPHPHVAEIAEVEPVPVAKGRRVKKVPPLCKACQRPAFTAVKGNGEIYCFHCCRAHAIYFGWEAIPWPKDDEQEQHVD